jgi:hypothetical protein
MASSMSITGMSSRIGYSICPSCRSSAESSGCVTGAPPRLRTWPPPMASLRRSRTETSAKATGNRVSGQTRIFRSSGFSISNRFAAPVTPRSVRSFHQRVDLRTGHEKCSDHCRQKLAFSDGRREMCRTESFRGSRNGSGQAPEQGRPGASPTPARDRWNPSGVGPFRQQRPASRMDQAAAGNRPTVPPHLLEKSPHEFSNQPGSHPR